MAKAATAMACAALLASDRLVAQSTDAAAPPLDLTMPRVVRDCPASRDEEEIVVCGRTPERSPYRVPPPPERFDPYGPVDSVSRERHRLYELGETGIQSCSNVGPGGWTGCDVIRWRQAREQHGR